MAEICQQCLSNRRREMSEQNSFFKDYIKSIMEKIIEIKYLLFEIIIGRRRRLHGARDATLFADASMSHRIISGGGGDNSIA